MCNEPFICKKSLQKHAKKVHDTGLQKFKYNCPQCTKGMDDRTEFTVHMDRHVNIKHFKCNVCDQAFYSQSQLTAHTKNLCLVTTSSVVTEFECSVCGAFFKTEDRYREHFKHQHVDNEDPKPFFCELCISQMWTAKGFEKHMEKCDGLK